MTSKLRRAKSESDLSKSNNSYSCGRFWSEADVYNDVSSEYDEKRDLLATFDTKIDRLTDLFLEQCRLLTEIKDELHESKAVVEKYEQAQNKFIDDFLKNNLEERACQALKPTTEENSRARSLLNAIEMKNVFSLDRDLRDSLHHLLHSDELKDRVVSATAETVRASAESALAAAAERARPLLTRAHRRLAHHLTATVHRAFDQLEAQSTEASRAVCRASRWLRAALDRHHESLTADCPQLRSVLQQVLEKEVVKWRESVMEVSQPFAREDQEVEEEGPDSPPQPPNPNTAVIDQLMKTAVIEKQIADGDIAEAFMGALSSADLSLVVAACRALPPARLRHLPRPALLALAQQLPTDMVHDTQLKCRYLEETILNLDPMHPEIHAHLPLIVSEIRKHLSNFLAKYPGHLASRRITLIIMAADNLLK